MLGATSSKLIRSWANQLQLNRYQTNQLFDFFEVKEVGDFIYPGVLKSRINVDIVDVYRLLEILKDEHFLTPLFEIYCSSCHKTTGKFITTLSEYAGPEECEHCSNQINIFTDSIVLYRIIGNFDE